MLTVENLKDYIDLEFELAELEEMEVTQDNLKEYISRLMDVTEALEAIGDDE